jgi:hypothetical protein
LKWQQITVPDFPSCETGREDIDRETFGGGREAEGGDALFAGYPSHLDGVDSEESQQRPFAIFRRAGQCNVSGHVADGHFFDGTTTRRNSPDIREPENGRKA